MPCVDFALTQLRVMVTLIIQSQTHMSRQMSVDLDSDSSVGAIHMIQGGPFRVHRLHTVSSNIRGPSSKCSSLAVDSERPQCF